MLRPYLNAQQVYSHKSFRPFDGLDGAVLTLPAPCSVSAPNEPYNNEISLFNYLSWNDLCMNLFSSLCMPAETSPF